MNRRTHFNAFHATNGGTINRSGPDVLRPPNGSPACSKRKTARHPGRRKIRPGGHNSPLLASSESTKNKIPAPGVRLLSVSSHSVKTAHAPSPVVKPGSQDAASHNGKSGKSHFRSRPESKTLPSKAAPALPQAGKFLESIPTASQKCGTLPLVARHRPLQRQWNARGRAGPPLLSFAFVSKLS